jgi:ATP phosphoribosyltransferase
VIKIALPKGRYMKETAALLQRADWGLSGYHEKARLYHLESQKFPELRAKIFHERDIPIQVAVGNYDLGICGLDWIEELLAKYPSSALVKVRNLGYGYNSLSMAVSRFSRKQDLDEIRASSDMIRIASEYPNQAESFALGLRLKRFSIFPLWGVAEAYPPDSAELALVPEGVNGGLGNYDLVSVSEVLSFSAFLIANRDSWKSKDMDAVLTSISSGLLGAEAGSAAGKAAVPSRAVGRRSDAKEKKGLIRLALPDGHQQQPTVELLNKAGIEIDDYPSPTGNRRPAINLEGVMVKVIRPQDMPLQVANGNFDLAITGYDWLTEHLNQFPSSPVTRLADLKFGKVKIVAVVSSDLAVSDVSGLRQFSRGSSVPLRVASEYVNIADKYARDNHLGMYRVIPTWGATEAFLPDDADLLIENTETGRTIARHNLKIIDKLFESTACLVGNKKSISSPARRDRIKSIAETLQAAVEDN